MNRILKNTFKKHFLCSKYKIIRIGSEKFLKYYILKFHTYFKGPHPEKTFISKYLSGKGIDVGCGGDKVITSAIGVDLTPKGEYGKYGSQEFLKSQADICALGDKLPMIKTGSLDYVVSRHCVEHFQDFLSPIFEWKRVLKKGGLLCIALPDDSMYNSIAIDPSHKHVFTTSSFKKIIELIGGFKIIKIHKIKESLSFVTIAERIN